MECATCGEYFCRDCNAVVHGQGKRQLHLRRKLFNYYHIRCDHGDGDFPSIWPSDMAQDRQRGYDFVYQTPLANYDEVVQRIRASVAVSFGETPTKTDSFNAAARRKPDGDQSTVASAAAPEATPSAHAPSLQALLADEHDYDDQGDLLWEPFYDHARGEQRYYHRKTKRVVTVPPPFVVAQEPGEGPSAFYVPYDTDGIASGASEQATAQEEAGQLAVEAGIFL